MEKIRNDYFDNIKSVLITLVVIGHFFVTLGKHPVKGWTGQCDLSVSYAHVYYGFRLFCERNVWQENDFDGSASESFYGSICFFRSYQG